MAPNQFTHQTGSEYLILGCYALQRHNTENSKQIFPEKVLCGLTPNVHIHVSMTDLLIPTIKSAYSARKYADRSWEYTCMFMYRRPTLCTLHIALDFLKLLKIAVVWGGGGGRGNGIICKI
jgi:hypothetical protein